MSGITIDSLREILERRFGGVLKQGKHRENGQCCALELLSVARGIEWTDDPVAVACIDLRDLNDATWSSDKTRAKHMLPVIAALSAWSDWGADRQSAFAEHVTIGVVNKIVAELPNLPKEIASLCRAATSLAAAESAAAKSAKWAAKSAKSGEWAAKWAAESAKLVEWAAKWAAKSAEWAAKSAESGDWAAKWAAKSAKSGEWAAKWAAESAKWAANSAEWAVKSWEDEPLITMCSILVEAANQ